MKSLDKIRKALEQQNLFLRTKCKVKGIGIFRSYILDEQKGTNDLDILVEFIEPISLLKFVELENSISYILRIKLDLVEKKLKPHIGKYILQEVVII